MIKISKTTGSEACARTLLAEVPETARSVPVEASEYVTRRTAELLSEWKDALKEPVRALSIYKWAVTVLSSKIVRGPRARQGFSESGNLFVETARFYLRGRLAFPLSGAYTLALRGKRVKVDVGEAAVWKTGTKLAYDYDVEGAVLFVPIISPEREEVPADSKKALFLDLL